MRAVIIAAGEATRWANHLNTPKHLVEVNGERILNRTARLLLERDVIDVHIIARDSTDDRYRMRGAVTHTPELRAEYADADKFLSSRHLWNAKGRTVVFYGDVYYTASAMDTIVNHAGRQWALFARPDESALTGSQYGECFALSFYPDDHATIIDALWHLVHLYQDWKIDRCGGWETYRALLGRFDLADHFIGRNFVCIDDWTDDFDYPHDYDEFIRRRHKLSPRKRTPIDPFDDD